MHHDYCMTLWDFAHPNQHQPPFYMFHYDYMHHDYCMTLWDFAHPNQHQPAGPPALNPMPLTRLDPGPRADDLTVDSPLTLANLQHYNSRRLHGE